MPTREPDAHDPFEGVTAGDPGGVAESAAPDAYLLIRCGGTTRVAALADGDEVVVGRSREATVPVDDERVSRKHARFFRRGGHVFVADLGSRHGTRVASRVLHSAEARLGAGDVVRVGGAEILVATATAGTAPAQGAAAAARPADDLVVADPKSAEVVELARKLARAPSTVLILGKTGVGKEVLSRLIHAWSPRAQRPFVRINCAAIPDTLLESELFGSERGAFTGADRRRIGHIEAASTGSLFLDEVGELSPSAQAKLLGVLENRVIVRVGGTAEIPVDVRLLCATHRDLREEVARGRFREDLFYRVSTFTLRIPSLAERPSEIVPLASVFARRFALSLGHAEPRLEAPALDALQAYAWPGNVRELRNAIEHAVVLADGEPLSLQHLPETVRGCAPRATDAPTPVAPSSIAPAMRDRVEDVERRAIEDALAAEGGNQTRAAERLGISRRALTYKLAKYGFDRPRK